MPKQKTEEKGLAKTDAAGNKLAVPFGPLTMPLEQASLVAEALSTNLGGGTLDPFALPHLTVPSSGTTTWEVPTSEGPVEVKEFNAVILVLSGVKRQYFEKAFKGAGGPPDCASADGILGIGDPGGDCANCELATWGSSAVEGSRGQACSERRHLFLLADCTDGPLFFNMPATSGKLLTEYLGQIGWKGMMFHQVATTIALEKHQTANSPEFSRTTFKFGGVLPPEAAEIAAQFKSALEDAIAVAPPDPRDQVAPRVEADLEPAPDVGVDPPAEVDFDDPEAIEAPTDPDTNPDA